MSKKQRMRRFLVEEPMGVVELPVLVFSGNIDPETRKVLADNNIRVDRSPGVYQVIQNASLFGLRGKFSYQDIRDLWTAGIMEDEEWEPVGPVVEVAGYTYAMLVPNQAISGFLLNQWHPQVG